MQVRPINVKKLIIINRTKINFHAGYILDYFIKKSRALTRRMNTSIYCRAVKRRRRRKRSSSNFIRKITHLALSMTINLMDNIYFSEISYISSCNIINANLNK